MNPVSPNRPTSLAIKKTTAKLFILGLVALAFIAVPITVTVLACPNPNNTTDSSDANNNTTNNNNNNQTQTNATLDQFKTVLQGFCQAFKADLQRDEHVTDTEFQDIVNGNSVKGVENSTHNLTDQQVNAFEKNEVSFANDDFNSGTTYAPDACGLSGRDQAADKTTFQDYFDNKFNTLGIGGVDSVFTDAIRPAGSSNTTTNSTRQSGTTSPQPGTVYKIVNRASGLVLDVQGASTTPQPPAPIIQYTDKNTPNQHWTLTQDSGRFFTIINSNSNEALDVPKLSTQPEIQLEQYTISNAANQQWLFVRAGGGYFTIVNNNSKLVLDTSGGEVVQNTKSSGEQSQQWKLVPVS